MDKFAFPFNRADFAFETEYIQFQIFPRLKIAQRAKMFLHFPSFPFDERVMRFTRVENASLMRRASRRDDFLGIYLFIY